MSPFRYCDKISAKKTPCLIVHGKNDPNAGTKPMQSERLFEGIKGTGGV